MIDSKKYEELCAKRAELDAKDRAYRALGEFVTENMDYCFKGRLFMEYQVWHDLLKENNARMTKLCDEYDKVIEEIKYT